MKFGASRLGRLKYRTAEEARGAADDLGLDDVHSHNMDPDNDGRDERLFMPGKSHDSLNDSLTDRGLDPMPAMGGSSGGGSGAMKMDNSEPMQMSSDGMSEMFPKKQNAMSTSSSDSMAGSRPSGSGMFNIYGDSDDDGDMEIY
jgi:hypothetical protein